MWIHLDYSDRDMAFEGPSRYSVRAATYGELLPRLWRRIHAPPPEETDARLESLDGAEGRPRSPSNSEQGRRVSQPAGQKSQSPQEINDDAWIHSISRAGPRVRARVTFSDGSAPLSLTAESPRYLFLQVWEALHSRDPAYLGELIGRTREIRGEEGPSPDGGRRGDDVSSRRGDRATPEERWEGRNRAWRRGLWMLQPQGERDFFYYDDWASIQPRIPIASSEEWDGKEG